MSRLRGHRDSFKYAGSGIKTAFQQEPNFQVHVVIAVLALISAVLLKFDEIEFLILLFTIGLVLILEMINTTLEALVDLVSPKKHPKAKIAKDVSAAAVLIASILALIVAAVLFYPKVVANLPLQ